MICIRSETCKSFAFLSVFAATRSRGLMVVIEEAEVIQINTYHTS